MRPLVVPVWLSLLACVAAHRAPTPAAAARPPAAPVPGRLRLLQQLRDGANATELRRPIITGCLEECGTVSQACVTDCQVCVETARCPSLVVNCTACLNEARDARTQSLNVLNLAIDSGGVSLEREGLRQKLEKARIEAVEAKRRVREARGAVLQAQRDAEWAMQRSRGEIAGMAKAKEELHKSKVKAAEWELRHARKVKRMRAHVAELRVEHMRTLEHLKEVRKKLHVARLRVKTNPEDHRAIHATAVFGKSWQQLRWKVEAQKRAIAEAEKGLQQEIDDGAWVLKGVRKDVNGVAKGVQDEYHDLHDSEGTERAARKRLNSAKSSYKELAQKSQELAVKTADLRAQLRAIRLPNFGGEGPDGEGPEGGAPADVPIDIPKDW